MARRISESDLIRVMNQLQDMAAEPSKMIRARILGEVRDFFEGRREVKEPEEVVSSDTFNPFPARLTEHYKDREEKAAKAKEKLAKMRIEVDEITGEKRVLTEFDEGEPMPGFEFPAGKATYSAAFSQWLANESTLTQMAMMDVLDRNADLSLNWTKGMGRAALKWTQDGMGHREIREILANTAEAQRMRRDSNSGDLETIEHPADRTPASASSPHWGTFA